MWIVLVTIYFLGTTLLLLFILSCIWPPHSPWAPWWRSNKKTAEAICKLSEISKKDILFDLGCGDGEVLILAAKKYGAKGIGIEIDPLRFLIAKMRVWFNGVSDKVKIVRGNFFDQDFSKATIINVYLVPKTLAKLKTQFQKQLKPKTKIISYVYEIDLPLKKQDTRNRLRLYQI